MEPDQQAADEEIMCRIESELPVEENRVYVITGAAGGIGRATAEVLAGEGHRVVVTDIDQAAGENLTAQITSAAGGVVRFEQLDVRSPEAVEELAEQLESDGWPVFGVMANAGIAPPSPATDYSADLWNTTVDINLNGVFWTCQAFGKKMIQRGSGSIVITSSIAGFGVVSPERHAAYGATKAAVAHLAALLGVEWARSGVRVNAVAPGYTNTPILEKARSESPDVFDQWMERIPIGRLNTPLEIANATSFLLSDRASGITATTLHVDGGYSAC
ncbi:SDR family NAD(P)-dependent oxidoreductase [Arthrobacter sp. Soil736]|uniref:SDR family NAD(P)-dependent oxidoreductase n=1 Tax=Arthrobacter sp. Soil736 TaxID=1736395 RepID=UPI0006FFF1D6|nr:SDR family NAD(P)-dependent oxidoreductase [Arthrobacter sp. Soil736]